jgi:hypothetical protein
MQIEVACKPSVAMKFLHIPMILLDYWASGRSASGFGVWRALRKWTATGKAQVGPGPTGRRPLGGRPGRVRRKGANTYGI